MDKVLIDETERKFAIIEKFHSTRLAGELRYDSDKIACYTAFKAMDEFANQENRIEAEKVLEFLSNHKLDFQPASGGKFIGLNMEIYTPTEIYNLYLQSIK